MNETKDVNLVEWQYVYAKTVGGFWVIKDDRYDYEKNGYTISRETTLLKKGEDPNKTYFPISNQIQKVNDRQAIPNSVR